MNAAMLLEQKNTKYTWRSNLRPKTSLYYIQVEVEDVEGRIRDFFRGLFGRDKKPEDDYEELEEEEDDEDDFIEDEGAGGGNPFVRDGKLYGQDYDKLKVTLSYLFLYIHSCQVSQHIFGGLLWT